MSTKVPLHAYLLMKKMLTVEGESISRGKNSRVFNFSLDHISFAQAEAIATVFIKNPSSRRKV